MMKISSIFLVAVFVHAFHVSAQLPELAMDAVRNSILNDALTTTAEATRSFLNNQHGKNSLRNLRHITHDDNNIMPSANQQLLNDNIEFVASLAETLLVSDDHPKNGTTENESGVWSDSVLVSKVESLEPNSIELVPKIKLDDNRPRYQQQPVPTVTADTSIHSTEWIPSTLSKQPMQAKNMVCHVHESKLHCTTIIIDNVIFNPEECTTSPSGIMACERNIDI